MSAGSRAIVLGGSLAGLMAAQGLSGHVDEVVIVERDHLPAEPSPRKGVPQGRHVHSLLLRGLIDMERLFPGITRELVDAGAQTLSWTDDVRVRTVWGWFPHYQADLVGAFCSRDLYEDVIRRRARALGSLTVLDGHEAVELISRNGTVVGVRLRRRGVAAGPGSTIEIEGALVVDACGRSTRASTWLEQMGFGAPASTDVDPFLGYATRVYRIPEQHPAPWRILLVRNRLPSARAGVIVPIEGGRWIVTLAGFGGDYPPQDEPGFLAFADSIDEPSFADAFREAEPLTDVIGYRRTANQWRHYERLSRWPRGFVVVGDAVCSFNPIYGQGMTLAAMGAFELGRALADEGLTPTFGDGFRGRLARHYRAPWLMATSEDYRYPGTKGAERSHALRLSHWYSDRVIKAAIRSEEVHYRWLRVAHLLDPPSAMVHPRILRRALVPR